MTVRDLLDLGAGVLLGLGVRDPRVGRVVERVRRRGGEGSRRRPQWWGHRRPHRRPNPAWVFVHLVDAGLNESAAVAVLGDLTARSGGDPLHGGRRGPARGIAAWPTQTSWRQFARWAAKAGRDPWALDTQLDHLVRDLRIRGTWAQLVPVARPGARVDPAAVAVAVRVLDPTADDDRVRSRTKLGLQVYVGFRASL